MKAPPRFGVDEARRDRAESAECWKRLQSGVGRMFKMKRTADGNSEVIVLSAAPFVFSLVITAIIFANFNPKHAQPWSRSSLLRVDQVGDRESAGLRSSICKRNHPELWDFLIRHRCRLRMHRKYIAFPLLSRLNCTRSAAVVFGILAVSAIPLTKTSIETAF